MSDNDDLDEIREEFGATDHGTQLDETRRDDDVDALVAALDAIEREGDNMVGYRHTGAAALLQVIVDDGRADEIGAALEAELGQDPSHEGYKRSNLAAYATLVGFQAVAPQLVEDLYDARMARKRRL